MAFLGPYLAAAALLVVAGALKAARPGATATALAVAVARPRRLVQPIVRVAAALECLLGAAALLWPAPPLAAAVAASYLGFAGYVLWARANGGALSSCGCFGTPDTPPTLAHAAVDVALATAAALVAVDGTTGTTALALAGQPADGIPLVLAAATCALLAYGVLTPLARVHGARRLYLEQA